MTVSAPCVVLVENSMHVEAAEAFIPRGEHFMGNECSGGLCRLMLVTNALLAVQEELSL